MIDLAQVSLALRNCTPRSLILLDEFGKGTLSTGSLTPLALVFALSRAPFVLLASIPENFLEYYS